MVKSVFNMIAFILTCGMLCTGCSSGTTKNAATSTPSSASSTEPTASSEELRVRLTLQDGKTIDMELYPDIAPLTVEFFLKAVESGYYSGKVFHRAIPGFMIQGGSKNGNGIGGMDSSVKGEFADNGVKNPLKHTRGVVSMARSASNDSASGQFFIMHADYPSLDGKYAAFGKVTSGMDVVDEIAQMPTGGAKGDELIEKPVIKSITIIEASKK